MLNNTEKQLLLIPINSNNNDNQMTNDNQQRIVNNPLAMMIDSENENENELEIRDDDDDFPMVNQQQPLSSSTTALTGLQQQQQQQRLQQIRQQLQSQQSNLQEQLVEQQQQQNIMWLMERNPQLFLQTLSKTFEWHILQKKSELQKILIASTQQHLKELENLPKIALVDPSNAASSSLQNDASVSSSSSLQNDTAPKDDSGPSTEASKPVANEKTNDAAIEIEDNDSNNENSSSSSSSSSVSGRKTTKPLKAWLDANRENPYPTLQQKLDLAQECGMKVRQIETWFTNHRKRNITTKKTPPNLQKKKDFFSHLAAKFQPNLPAARNNSQPILTTTTTTTPVVNNSKPEEGKTSDSSIQMAPITTIDENSVQVTSNVIIPGASGIAGTTGTVLSVV